jgi:hypothetical protein
VLGLTHFTLIDLIQAEQASNPYRVQEPWANDPDDDGNGIVGAGNAVLIELVVLVALVVLLRWLV